MGRARSLRQRALLELQALGLDAVGVEELVDGLVHRAARRIGCDAHVTITLHRPGSVVTVAASDSRAAMCDRVEYDARAGPCVTAIARGSPVVVPDVLVDERWPGWRATTASQGFGAGLSVPADVQDGISICVNVYSEDSGPWSAEALARAGLYAEELACTLRLCLRSVEPSGVSADVRAASRSRATIDRAMGVIMAENRCSADEAMDVLRSAAKHRDVTLREVSATVIEGITGLASSSPQEFHDERR